jgi:hypothetical protein
MDTGRTMSQQERRTRPPSGSAVARDRTGLTLAAAEEPELSLLLGAACVAIVIHSQEGIGGGGGG